MRHNHVTAMVSLTLIAHVTNNWEDPHLAFSACICKHSPLGGTVVILRGVACC